MDSVTHSLPSLQSNSYFCIFETKIPEKRFKGIKLYFSSWQQESMVDTLHMMPDRKANDDVQQSVPSESLPQSRFHLLKVPMLQHISSQRLSIQNIIQLGIIQIKIITASLF